MAGQSGFLTYSVRNQEIQTAPAGHTGAGRLHACLHTRYRLSAELRHFSAARSPAGSNLAPCLWRDSKCFEAFPGPLPGTPFRRGWIAICMPKWGRNKTQIY